MNFDKGFQENILICCWESTPSSKWHTVEVLEPSVIFEAKDGAYVSAKNVDVWTYE